MRNEASDTIQKLRMELLSARSGDKDIAERSGLARELEKVRSSYAALQMKYERDVEQMRLSAEQQQHHQQQHQQHQQHQHQQQDGSGGGPVDVSSLLADKYTLEQQLKEVRDIERARKSAFEELEGKIVDIARRTLGVSGKLATTMDGRTIDPSEALAKELIATKIAVSESQRKMRMMARTEMELRTTIERREMEREEREERTLKTGSGSKPTAIWSTATKTFSSKEIDPEDHAELVRQLATSVSRVRSLEREITSMQADGGQAGDVDVGALYGQVSASAAREKKLRVELISTKSELKSLRETLDQIVTGRDVGGSGIAGIAEIAGADVRKAHEKAIDARISYLEDALKTSESQRRRLDRHTVVMVLH